MERRLDDLEATVDDVDDRLADLEAAVQALRGFAGGVRAVDEEVERRANAAVARVERLEADLREMQADGTRVGPPDGTDTGAEHDRGRSDTTAAVDETDGRPDGEVPSAPPRERSDATLAAAVADAADAVDHADPDPDPETDGRSGSLADRVRRLL